MKNGLVFTLLLTLIISGCGTLICPQQKCPELDYSKCPKVTCPDIDCPECPKTTKIEKETIIVTKYQCADGSVKDDISDCSEKKISTPSTPLKFSGSSDTFTEKFYLEAGIAEVYGNFQSSKNAGFIIYLWDDEGDKNLLFSEPAPYSGKALETIEHSGNYRLEASIFGTGTWEVEIKK